MGLQDVRRRLAALDETLAPPPSRRLVVLFGDETTSPDAEMRAIRNAACSAGEPCPRFLIVRFEPAS